MPSWPTERLVGPSEHQHPLFGQVMPLMCHKQLFEVHESDFMCPVGQLIGFWDHLTTDNHQLAQPGRSCAIRSCFRHLKVIPCAQVQLGGSWDHLSTDNHRLAQSGHFCATIVGQLSGFLVHLNTTNNHQLAQSGPHCATSSCFRCMNVISCDALAN